MKKEEKVIEQTVENSTVINEDNLQNEDENVIDNNISTEDSDIDDTLIPTIDEPVVSTEDQTLAPTDDVIPAPVEEPAPLADTVPPIQDIPVDAPVEEPGSEVTCTPTDVVDSIIPEDPAPVVSDVTPECGDENPTDGCCTSCDNSGMKPCDSVVTVANFFGTIQECVTIVWRFHLKTRKHHIHVTLNEFYEKALDIVDDIIEQYQGICGVIEDPFVNCIVGDGKTEGEYLTELKAFVENNKCVLGDHSEINSTIDEFLALIDSTNYKLTAFTESAVKSFDEFVYEDYPSIKESYHFDKFGEKSDDSDSDNTEKE